MSTAPGLREAVHNVLPFFFERRYCLLETKAINLGVWGRAPVLLLYFVVICG